MYTNLPKGFQPWQCWVLAVQFGFSVPCKQKQAKRQNNMNQLPVSNLSVHFPIQNNGKILWKTCLTLKAVLIKPEKQDRFLFPTWEKAGNRNSVIAHSW